MTISHLKKNFYAFFVLTIVFLTSVNTAVSQPDGQALFKSNCAQCHATSDKLVVGPGLKGVDTRHDKEWLHNWIQNSQAMVKSGDKTAVALFNEYNKSVMPVFNLKIEEIDAILAYVKAEESKIPAGTTAGAGAPAPEAAKSNPTNTLLLVAGILFILILILGRIKSALAAVSRERKGLPTLEPVPMGQAIGNWMGGHKKIVAISILVLIVMGGKAGWDALAGIGISQGYQPDQPIAFSHEIHAGQNGINCQYCHSSAAKDKTAGIPSANVCMNCHKYIKEGPTTGTEEIAKIYTALDYDPATNTYGSNQKPIQWTRVHNLPDLAYFNHAQHVTVGQIECQTCHGEMEKQTVANQHAPLTMGWCIDCHRTTEVKMDGNAYYDDYHSIYPHSDGKEKMTVEKIGGLECARCHY